MILLAAVLALQPEVKVKVSIHDLLRRMQPTKSQAPAAAQPEPRLPDGYALAVAAVIERARPHLLSCLKNAAAGTESFETRITIAKDGLGRAENLSKPEPARADAIGCILGVLSATAYPPHQLNSNITVRLPLELESRLQ